MRGNTNSSKVHASKNNCTHSLATAAFKIETDKFPLVLSSLKKLNINDNNWLNYKLDTG
jgi:hypothetical protein